MHFSSFLSLVSTVLFACVALAQTPGTIQQPAVGTHIMPGASFAFQYNPRSGSGNTSYNFEVFVLTKPPSDFLTTDDWADGHSYGRFPSNSSPMNLTMPDFSLSTWGGTTAANANYSVVVFEEWIGTTPNLGRMFAVEANSFIYNATSS